MQKTTDHLAVVTAGWPPCHFAYDQTAKYRASEANEARAGMFAGCVCLVAKLVICLKTPYF